MSCILLEEAILVLYVDHSGPSTDAVCLFERLTVHHYASRPAQRREAYRYTLLKYAHSRGRPPERFENISQGPKCFDG